jgi:hypothetical protein
MSTLSLTTEAAERKLARHLILEAPESWHRCPAATAYRRGAGHEQVALLVHLLVAGDIAALVVLVARGRGGLVARALSPAPREDGHYRGDYFDEMALSVIHPALLAGVVLLTAPATVFWFRQGESGPAVHFVRMVAGLRALLRLFARS